MPFVTVLWVRNFACTSLRAEPFYVHENQYTQILNLLSPANGTAIATLVFSGNTLFSILEFMAVVSIGAKKFDVILMRLVGIVSITTTFLVSISFISFFTLSTVLGLKEKKYWFLFPSGIFFSLICLIAGVILAQVYKVSNFICVIYISHGEDGFRLNATTYFNNMTVK